MVLGTTLALCAGTMANPAAENRARQVEILYQQGVSALKDGDTTTAAQMFREVLRRQPSHGNARYQLLNLSRARPDLAAKVRQRKLTQIRVPKVRFDDTTFSDALEVLDAMITKETDGEFSANFVVQDPHGQLGDQLVTMQLGAVPANVVLDYLLGMVNAKARYDEHAIVIQPIGRPQEASAPTDGDGPRKGDRKDPFSE